MICLRYGGGYGDKTFSGFVGRRGVVFYCRLKLSLLEKISPMLDYQRFMFGQTKPLIFIKNLAGLMKEKSLKTKVGKGFCFQKKYKIKNTLFYFKVFFVKNYYFFIKNKYFLIILIFFKLFNLCRSFFLWDRCLFGFFLFDVFCPA